jgi:hypothetical protein
MLDVWQIDPPNPSEATRNARSQTRRLPILYQSLAKQLPRFFFHGSTMTRCPQAERGL